MLAFIWGIPAMAAFTPGRDYHPSVAFDDDADTANSMKLALDDALILDALNAGGIVAVYYQKDRDVFVAPYDLTTGVIDSLSADLVLLHDTATGSYEHDGISGASVQLCHAVPVTGDSLTSLGGGRYEASHIGISPGTISVSGCDCPNPTYAGGFHPGFHHLGGSYSGDNFLVGNTAACTCLKADYKYTDCSYYDSSDFTASFVCRFDYDPDTAGDTDTDPTRYFGACKFFMIYEGRFTSTDDTDTAITYNNHALLAAYSRQVSGPWTRYLPGGDTVPDASDVVLFNTGRHQFGDTGDYTLTGGPSLIWDGTLQVWRMVFSGDPYGHPNTMYSESPTDGKGWGLTTSGYGEAPSAPDCYNTSTPAWDTAVCAFPAWDSTPGDPPDIASTPMVPDLVDPDIILVNVDTDTDLELLMFGKGADGSCDGGTNPQDGVILVSVHQDLGNMGVSDYVWDTSVERDPGGYGRVMDERSYTCPNDTALGPTEYDRIADPTTVAYPLGGGEFGYIMFYQMDQAIYVAGSNFACSDFKDEPDTGLDPDTAVDYGEEDTLDCQSPTDNTEY